MINYIYVLNYLLDAILEAEAAFKASMTDADYKKLNGVVDQINKLIEVEIAKHDLKIDNLNG